MEWHPFSHIKHGSKTHPIPFWGLLVVGTFIPLIYFGLTKDFSGPIFTTTIDIENKQVLEKPITFYEEENFLPKILRYSFLSYKSLFKDSYKFLILGSPNTKYVKINPGLRKEEVAEKFGDKLNWSDEERNSFSSSSGSEGYYYPGSYVVLESSTPSQTLALMFERFDDEVVDRYPTLTKKVIKLDTALKVASLIEREAAGKHDTHLISGIIWNRIFAGMNLEIDASLQYAKGTEENGWWPRVTPKDKYIDSPYNTYQNNGLPPTAISNPSLASIEAALNPKKTKCIFYIHDKKKKIHCATNYEEHEKNIRKYLK